MTEHTRSVSRRMRFEILKRDGHRCRYCGATAPDVQLTVDHVIPLALGGDNNPSNLTTACRDCNAGKASVPPEADKVAEVNEMAERLRLAFKKVSEEDREERQKRFDVLDMVVCDFASEWNQLANETGKRHKLPNDARGSLIRFYESGLDDTDLYDAAFYMFHMMPPHIDGWRYFCGTCWGMIRQRTNKALEMASAEVLA